MGACSGRPSVDQGNPPGPDMIFVTRPFEHLFRPNSLEGTNWKGSSADPVELAGADSPPPKSISSPNAAP